MKSDYLEPWKRIYPTKNELLLAWSDWFESKTDEWELFTMTVVFKSGGKVPRPEKWEGEYKNRVLMKIRKRLEPGLFTDKRFVNLETQENREKLRGCTHVIPYEDFFYYEKDDSSLFRVSRSHKPHHIHSLLPIEKSQVHRFWSIDSDDLQDRIQKDIYSIETVQSVLVEKIKAGNTIDWIKYLHKGKSFQ